MKRLACVVAVTAVAVKATATHFAAASATVSRAIFGAAAPAPATAHHSKTTVL